MKILDFLGLTELVELCKETFALITHKHTLNDITDYTVDSTFSSTSTNPIQNKVVNNALVTIADDMDKIDADINKINDEKADKTDLPTKVSQLENDSNYATNEDVTTALHTSISDWNQNDENAADYIKNRTHYEKIIETGEVTEVYNDSVTDSVMLNAISYDFGEMLYVTFDDVKYKLYGHWSGVRCSYTSNDGDVPFYVVYDMVDAALYFTCKDSGTHMVLIEIPVVKSIVHKLDSKFIPDSVVDKEYLAQELDSSIADWNQSDETATSFIKNKPFYEDAKYSVVVDEKEIECYTAKGNGYYTFIEDEYVREDFLLNDEPKAFLWDGTMYNVERSITTHNNGQYIYFGNAYLLGISDNDTGLPFCVSVIIDDYIQVAGIEVYAKYDNYYTIALYKQESVVKTIDEKYLPDSVKNENIVHLQSDWNQSDEWSDDYIKNRPFYEEIVETGDVETLYEGTYTFSAAFTLPETIYNDVLYVTFNQENYTLTRHDVNPIEWDYHSTDGTELPFGLYYDGLESKMYFDLFGYEFTTDKVDVLIEAPVIEKNIVQLDEKFIPDTIARSSDLEPLNNKLTYHTDVEDVHMTDERKTQLTNAYTHSTNSNIHLTSEEKAQLLSHKDDVDNPHQILEKIESNSDLVVTELGDEIVGDSPELDPVVESRISEIETEVSSLKSDLDKKQPVGDYALKSEIPSAPVQSVNDKTGEVILTASDVGATTASYVDAEIAKLKAQGVQQTPLFASTTEECTELSKVYVLPDGYLYSVKPVEVPAVNNVLKTAQTSVTDTTPFKGVGYQEDACMTIDDTIEDASSFAPQQTGGKNIVTGFIPITQTDKIYFDKAYIYKFSTSRFYCWFYDANGTKLRAITPNTLNLGNWTSAATMGTQNNVVCLDLSVLQTITTGSLTDVKYAKFVRFSLQTDGSDPSEAIISINEEIDGSTKEEYKFLTTGIPFVTTEAINDLYEKTNELEANFEELQQKVENDIRVIAPPKIIGLVGHELNIYTDNMFLCDNIKNYEIRWSFTGNLNSIAIALEDCLRIPSTVENAMTDVMTLRIREKVSGELIKTIQIPIEIVAEPTITGKKVLFIGDSLTEATYYPAEIQNNLSKGGITSLGSRSNYVYINDVGMRVSHEGRSGWSVDNYLNAESYSGAVNEFYNPDTSTFDFSYYMTKQGYDGVDAVCIALGTNGVTSITENVNGINSMIDSIHTYDSNIKVFVALTTPPALQDGWRSIQNTDEWKRQQLALVEAYVTAFGSRTDNVGVIPWYIAINREYDFPSVEVAESTRNPVVIRRLNNNVHPSVYGYLKIADVTYNTLVANL